MRKRPLAKGSRTQFGLTGISSHLGAKLRDWAVRQAEAGCYSWAALSSNDSKTRYIIDDSLNLVDSFKTFDKFICS